MPNADVGDDCMAALILRPGSRFDPAVFAEFLSAQRDLGTKMAPRYVRIAESLPSTETNKILKRVLRDERWDCGDPVWLRDAMTYRLLGAEDRSAIVAPERGTPAPFGERAEARRAPALSCVPLCISGNGIRLASYAVEPIQSAPSRATGLFPARE